MSKIINLQQYKEQKEEENYNGQWIVQELMCVSCHYRYFSSYPDCVLLKEIECPKCHKIGTIFCTGQEIPDRNQMMAALDYLEQEFESLCRNKNKN